MFRNKSDYKKICEILNYKFKNQELLLQALTRTSGLNEGRQLKKIGNNQRLEFIGDKVLNLVISDVLMEYYPHWNEGKLTQATAKYVNNNDPLPQVARSLNLGEFLIMGLGEETHNRARENNKVLSDAMEALIGALWYDTNENYVFLKEFITKHWTPLGLLPSTNMIYEKIAVIIREEETSEKEKIQQFKTIFNRSLQQENLNAIFELIIDECDETEILEIILKTKRIEQLSLDTALIVSIEQGISKQVKLLLQYGANPNVICQKYQDYQFTVSVLQITILQIDGNTNYKDTFEIIKLLLKYGADPNWQESITTITPSEIVSDVIEDMRSICFPESDYEDLRHSGVSIGELLRRARNSKQEKKIEYKNLNTALHIVTQVDSVNNGGVLCILLKYGADSNLRNYEGKTPLHLICESFYKKDMGNTFTSEIIESLIKAGIKPNLQDVDGNTALHIMLKHFTLLAYQNDFNDFKEIIKKLISAGANPHIKNSYGKTVLNLAEIARCRHNSADWKEIIKILDKPNEFSKTNVPQYKLTTILKPSIFIQDNKNRASSSRSIPETSKKIGFKNS